MEENKESSISSKHPNSDPESDSSSSDNNNKLIESTGDAEENPAIHKKVSGEAENPLIYTNISAKFEDPVNHNEISCEDDDPANHNKISGEVKPSLIQSISKAENLPILNKISSEVGESLNQNKVSGNASPTSFSSSSQLLEIDYDENAFDISFSISEEDEDVTTNRQWSMMSQSPTAVQELPLSPENASPKQPPEAQVMERSNSYDPNRIPSSTFSRKLTDSTEWSADSNDSLFSLHLGRSGELNRTDSSFRLPTVVETTSEIDQKSTKGEIQNQSEMPIVDANGNGNGNGNGVNPSEMPCDSITTQSPPPPSPPPPPVPEGNEAAETKSGDGATTPKGRCRCFNCFNCFSCCTFCG